jgi:hypothetical protein
LSFELKLYTRVWLAYTQFVRLRLPGTWFFRRVRIALGIMNSEIRTVVTFESTAFNMAEPKEYFINPCCFGDDVAKWVIGELRKQGVEADEKPRQEDFGWYLNFEVASSGHCFVIGHRPTGESEAGTWIGWLERSRGLLVRYWADANMESSHWQPKQFTKSYRVLR